MSAFLAHDEFVGGDSLPGTYTYSSYRNRAIHLHWRCGTLCVVASYHFSYILSSNIFKRKRKFICCYFCFCTQTHVSVKKKHTKRQRHWLFRSLEDKLSTHLTLNVINLTKVLLGPLLSTPALPVHLSCMSHFLDNQVSKPQGGHTHFHTNGGGGGGTVCWAKERASCCSDTHFPNPLYVNPVKLMFPVTNGIHIFKRMFNQKVMFPVVVTFLVGLQRKAKE